ncbi:MAG: M15 family metallopeptidase [Verrucomicrobiales bacterium]|nr:M15 family metallopeptidase [Verrucomicrobiales bacterium]
MFPTSDRRSFIAQAVVAGASCEPLFSQGIFKRKKQNSGGSGSLDRKSGESAIDFAERAVKAGAIGTPSAVKALMTFGRAYPSAVTGVKREAGQDFVQISGAGGSQWRPLEDGNQGKSFEQRLDSPDLFETLHDSYPRDLTMTQWPKNLDPGRYRDEMFLKLVYGDSPARVRENLTTVNFAGKTLSFNRNNGAADALKRVGKKVEAAVGTSPAYRKYLEGIGGTFNWRNISGTSRLSAHSFGMTVDLNPALGGYWKWGSGNDLHLMERRRKYPPEIVAAFESEKFIWGGKWYHYDLMHFEYRPEFFI